MVKIKPKMKRLNEEGFASIVIALVLIVVLALITIGFAQLARREQRSALSNQLATQAYYASESGINDTINMIQKVMANPSGGGGLPALVSLTPPSAGLGGKEDPNTCLEQQKIPGLSIPGPYISGNIDSSVGASYTCTLLNLTPPSLVYSGVSPGTGKNVTFSVSGPPGSGPLDHLTIHWGSTDGQNSFRPKGATDFAPYSSWGGAPAALEFSITPLPAYDRQSLINNVFTTYLYPSAGTGGWVRYRCWIRGRPRWCWRMGGSPSPGTVNYGTATSGQGQIVPGNCWGSGTYTCAVTVNGLPAAAQYLVRFTDYYDSSDITTDAYDASGTQLDFVNGQAQIDVTGRARNVLKRVQVRAPLQQPNNMPLYTLEGQNVCKRFDVYPGNTTIQANGLTGCNLN